MLLSYAYCLWRLSIKISNSTMRQSRVPIDCFPMCAAMSHSYFGTFSDCYLLQSIDCKPISLTISSNRIDCVDIDCVRTWNTNCSVNSMIFFLGTSNQFSVSILSIQYVGCHRLPLKCAKNQIGSNDNTFAFTFDLVVVFFGRLFFG